MKRFNFILFSAVVIFVMSGAFKSSFAQQTDYSAEEVKFSTTAAQVQILYRNESSGGVVYTQLYRITNTSKNVNLNVRGGAGPITIYPGNSFDIRVRGYDITIDQAENGTGTYRLLQTGQ